MALVWAKRGFQDLERLHNFLADVNPMIAGRSTQHILASVQRLAAQPMIGQRLPGFKERDIRRLLIDNYELRYELGGADIYVLRIFHTREDR